MERPRKASLRKWDGSGREAREWCIVDRSRRDKRCSRSRGMVVVAPRVSGLLGSRGLDGWGLSIGWINVGVEMKLLHMLVDAKERQSCV